MAMLGESGEMPAASVQSEPSAFKVAQELGMERQDLLHEEAIPKEKLRHFKRPRERDFTRAERGRVTLLFGGLSRVHDSLIEAATQGLGYTVKTMPEACKADFQTGKEYGNNGQCNPTYFTVGCLLNYLQRLRDEEGLSTREIVENYAFVTAGACGPCRFGMYEAEFRLALRNSGFDGFRIIPFQQKSGMTQEDANAGLEFNTDFGLVLLNCILIGDVLNALLHQIRPYEVHPGQTDRVFANVLEHMRECLLNSATMREQWNLLVASAALLLAPVAKRERSAKVIAQLCSTHTMTPLKACRRLIDQEIEIDFTRVKPICKITGEFWAQTTEGDGNFHMFEFLESQGAEVLVEPITTWVNYLISQARMRQADLKGLGTGLGMKEKLHAEFTCRKKQLALDIASRLLNREYNRIRAALGDTVHAQVCQLELQRMGHPYYNRKSGGGEGHLEIAKNIYYAHHGIAHMVMSLKPFGCLPSTQSDGAQAAVVSHYPGMTYIPIETSGEGDVSAHSRAQMALGEAKAKSKNEFQACLAETGYTLEQIRAYCSEHAELRKPLQSIPHRNGIAGKAANFVLHVALLMDKDRTWQA